MLGRLARWLRLIGYDTLYYPHIEDSLILRIAREEDRTLLTRDTRLVKVRGLKDFLLLKENDPFEQLKNVISTFSLISHSTLGKSLNIQELCRCSLCNQVLDIVVVDCNAECTRAKVFTEVPFDAYVTCGTICPNAPRRTGAINGVGVHMTLNSQYPVA